MQALLLFSLIGWIGKACQGFTPYARSRPTPSHRLHAVVQKSDQEWKEMLTPEQYQVLRQEGTEPPFSSPLNGISSQDSGIFHCAACRAPLFRPTDKYDSGTGWPSFAAPISNEAIALETDWKLIVPRTECKCASCDSHLGHVFADGPEPTGLRYCMNGVAMDFEDDIVEAEDYKNAPTVSPPISLLLPGLVSNTALLAWSLRAFQVQVLERSNHDVQIIPTFIILGIVSYFASQVVQTTKRLLLR